MKFQDLKEFLTLFLPLMLVSLGIGFVKVVFLKQEGSAFVKIAKFIASVTMGTIGGYISTKFFHDQGWQLVITAFVTLLADQITNRIDKTGLNEIIDYVKTKSVTKTDNTPDNG